MPEATVWKILVIEDRAGISASLLRNRPDFDVEGVHRLQAAERLFRERPDAPFHAILLDLSVADIADPLGLDAYRRVHALSPSLPITVLASAGAEEAQAALAAEGAAACLPRSSATTEAIAWSLRQGMLRAQVEARRYRDLFDSVPIGILLAAGRRVAMANPAALARLGYSNADLPGVTVLDFFPASMRATLESALDACIAGEAKEATFAATLLRKDRTPCQAQVFLKGALLNDAPALAFYLAFSETAVVREAPAPAVPATVPAPADSASLSSAPAAAGPEAVGSKMEALSRLAGGIAHDFNNLFTAINGYSEHLLTLPGAEGAMARGLKSIRKAGDAAAAMTRGLMAFSHPGTGDLRPVKLDAAIDDVAPMLSGLLGGGLELRIRPGAGTASARLEAGQLEQILLNLCANAKEAMSQVGAVALVTEAAETAEGEEFTHLKPASAGPFVVISVRDTGKGMAPDVQARLFEPYFSTKPGKGSGYGLASVYGIVRQAGGGITVGSAPGRGSVFRIWLPRAEALPAAPIAAPAVPAAAAGPGAPGATAASDAVAILGGHPPQDTVTGGLSEASGHPGRPQVMVVEDDTSLRDLLRAVLERYGYVVQEATSGADAEDRLEAADRLPDLLISDVLLLDGLGPDLVARLRASRPSLKALFISGHSVETLADQGIRIPPEDFLEKPFTPSQLARKVDALLSAQPRPSA